MYNFCNNKTLLFLKPFLLRKFSIIKEIVWSLSFRYSEFSLYLSFKISKLTNQF